MAIPEPGRPLRIPVEDRFDFTDLSRLEVRWRLGEERGLARAAGAPRSTGAVEVDLPRRPRPGELLELTFRSGGEGGGRDLDSFLVPLGEEPSHRPPFPEPGRGPLEAAEESTLAGRAVRISGSGFELAFDLDTGALRSAVAAGEPLLLEPPALHLLPTGRPLAPLPDRLSFRAKSVTWRREGESVTVAVAGGYPSLEGVYLHTVTPAGESARRPASGGTAMTPRPGGRSPLLRPPRGRPAPLGAEGRVARLPPGPHWPPRGRGPRVPRPPLGVGPAHLAVVTGLDAPGLERLPEREAAHLLGLRRISAGPPALLAGEGRRHIRCQVETDRISVHLLDWYGGSGSGLWEWTLNYGQGRTIRKGETLEESLSLRLAR